MRTLLAGEFATATAGSTSVDLYVKLEVQNGSGTWIDVGAAIGSYWIINAQWGEHIDTPTAQATFTLVQALSTTKSMAPLMSLSVLNVDDLGAYSPLLNPGRGIRMSTATMPIGVALDVTKYRKMFDGRIDSVDLADAVGAHAGPVTLACSDLGGWLMDHQIEVLSKNYGDPTTPPALETVMQNLITDNTASGEPAVTLVKESASNFAVTDYLQGDEKLMEALTALVLDSTGEDFRYRYDASHVSQPMWFNPDRTRVTVDQTFTANQYLLSKLDTALANIRNAGSLTYGNGVVTASDATSIALYRRRYFRLPPSPLLTTEAAAQTVIGAVVSDLAEPPAEAQALCPYYWFVQLYDRYTFTANSRQFDNDQTLAVTGLQHSIENSVGSTTLTLTGRIVGAYAKWLTRLAAPPDASLVDNALNDFKWTDSADGLTRTFTMVGGALVARVAVYSMTVAGSPLADPWPPTDPTLLAAWYAAGGMIQILTPDPITGVLSVAVTVPTSTQQAFVQFEPRLGDWSAGPVRRSVVDAQPIIPIGQGTAAVDSNGAYQWSVDGPSQQSYVAYAENTSAFPSDAAAAAGTIISGRQVSRTGGGPLTFGQTIYITIIPYTTDGTALASIRLRVSYTNSSGSRTSRYAATGLFDPAGAFLFTRLDWEYSPAGKTTTDGTGTPEVHYATLPVAQGMTLRAVRLRTNTVQVYSQVAMGLFRQDADGSSTQLGSTQTATHAGYSTLTVGSLSESVTSGRSYLIRCDTMYDTLHVNAAGTGMLWLELDQDYPNPVSNL